MDLHTTIKFVTAAHAGQLYGDLPFIVHPTLVARHFESDLLQTVAFLHDVVEDTHVTLDDIEALYGTLVRTILDALTRRVSTESYSEYILRLSSNGVARAVKIADLKENMRSASLWYPTYQRFLPRYQQALDFLVSLGD